MLSVKADVFCITELWIKRPEDFGLFTLLGYVTFGSCRLNKGGGNVLVLAESVLHPIESVASPVVSSSYFFNVCTIRLLGCSPHLVAAGVYLKPGATVGDTKSLFKQLDQVVSSCTSYLVLGDFNLKNIDWSLPNIPSRGSISGELMQFVL